MKINLRSACTQLAGMATDAPMLARSFATARNDQPHVRDAGPSMYPVTARSLSAEWTLLKAEADNHWTQTRSGSFRMPLGKPYRFNTPVQAPKLGSAVATPAPSAEPEPDPLDTQTQAAS